jgi:hypothetical protein
MIYACVRAWRECPNLLFWNVGAWSVLAMLASGFAESLLPVPTAMSIGFGPAIPTQPTFTELLFDGAHSEAFQFAQVGYAFCGFLLMLVAVARSVYRRLVVASADSGP